MATNHLRMIKKLQKGLNVKGQQILYNTKQFYSTKLGRPVTQYIIRKAVFDEEKGRNVNIELFSSCSQIDTLRFMISLWKETCEKGEIDISKWSKPDGKS